MDLIHTTEETLRQVRFWKDGTEQGVTAQEYCLTAVLLAQRAAMFR